MKLWKQCTSDSESTSQLQRHELLTDKTSILSRWSEHFQTLFNPDRTVQDPAILCIPQLPTKEELDEPLTMEETVKAIDQLTSGKAAAVDDIPPKIWKHGGHTLRRKLHELLICCWEQGKLPQDLQHKVIITPYKNKGEMKNLTVPTTGRSSFCQSLTKSLLNTA